MAWERIELAIGQSPRSDDYKLYLLSDGEKMGIGWIMRRGSGANKGMVSGYLGTNWTHFCDLPDLPK